MPDLSKRSAQTCSPVFASMSWDTIRSLSPSFADAAFDHVADAQFFSDLPHIDSLALVSEGGTAGDNHQIREARERRNDVFGHPVTQIAKVLVGAQIIEWKNGYRGNSGGDVLRLEAPSGEQFAEHPRAETRFAVCMCPSVGR